MFSAMFPIFFAAIRQAKSVHTRRMLQHCRVIGYAVTREIKRAKNPAEKFKICKRVRRAIRAINHAYKRK